MGSLVLKSILGVFTKRDAKVIDVLAKKCLFYVPYSKCHTTLSYEINSYKYIFLFYINYNIMLTYSTSYIK